GPIRDRLCEAQPSPRLARHRCRSRRPQGPSPRPRGLRGLNDPTASSLEAAGSIREPSSSPWCPADKRGPMTRARALRVVHWSRSAVVLPLLWVSLPLSAAPRRTASSSDGARGGEVTISTAEYRRLVEAGERPSGPPGQELTFEGARFHLTIEK